ncbi:M15 family metallopeptidase [Rummeliibacillus sp. JY-2-4R]
MDISVQGLIANSNKRVGSINPNVQSRMELIIERCHKRGVYVIFTQGMRTLTEQAILYGQGRSSYIYNGVNFSQMGNPIVTNAIPGTSIHNYGLAIDFAIIKGGEEIVWDEKADFDRDGKADWMDVVEEAKKLGFEWGGDWTTFKVYSHLEWVGNLTYSQIFNGKKPHFPSLVKEINPNNYYISGKGRYKIIKASYIYDGLVFSKSKKLKTFKKGTVIEALAIVHSGQTTRLKVMIEGKIGYVSGRKTIVQKVPDPVYHKVKKGEN